MTDDTRKQVVDISKAKTAALVQERRNALARRAYDMHVAGMSYYQIGVELGLADSESKRLVVDTIRAAADMVDSETKSDLLDLELARLDALQNAVWPRAMEGNVRANEQAMRLVLARAKLLGMEVPVVAGTTLNTVVVPASDEQYAAALRMIASGGR
jgi:hypothetical protein